MQDRAQAFDLAAFLPYRFAVVAEELSRGLARQYRAEFGISVPEWRVLVHLLQSDSVSVRDIERRTHLEKSTASRAASRLEAAGYLSKRTHGGDRRLVELSLTPEGHALMTRLIPLANRYQSDLEARLAQARPGLEAALDILMASGTEESAPPD